MLRVRPLVLVLALALATPAVPLLAQGRAEPSSAALQLAVVNATAQAEAARGTPRRDSTARPGDVLRYTITFTNTRPRAVRNVVLNGPLPMGTTLVAGSPHAEQARLELSVDGGRTFSAQPMVTVVSHGQTSRHPATPAEVTAVRWIVDGDIAPGARVTATYAVRVLDGAAAPAAP